MTEQPNQFRIGQRVRMTPCNDHPDGLSATIISTGINYDWLVEFRDGTQILADSDEIIPETFIELTADEQTEIDMCLEYVLFTLELSPDQRNRMTSIRNKLKEYK